MQLTKPRILSGFQELLPKEQMTFNAMRNKIESVFKANGFLPIDTPVMELEEVLLAKAGGETEKQIYSFKKGDNNLCLRFDLTVPLARYVAMHYNELSFPFKKYQIGKSYRGERPQKGRFREFLQCDVDIIGEDELSIYYDAECVSVLYEIFTSFKINDFVVFINNRKLLNGFVETLGEKENSAEILRIIDKLDKIGIENVRLMLADLGLSKETIEKIESLIMIDGSQDEVISKLEKLNIQNETFIEGLNELKEVYVALQGMNVPLENYKFDIKTVRGLDYYTGTVFETKIKSHPEYGSVGGGGRYSNLTSHYSTKHLIGVGVSVGLTRLFSLLRDNNMLPSFDEDDVLVAIIPLGDTIKQCFALSAKLKQSGLNVDVYHFNKSFKYKLNYANKHNIPYVLIVGEDEVKENLFSLKDMCLGAQEKLSIEEIINKLKK